LKTLPVNAINLRLIDEHENDVENSKVNVHHAHLFGHWFEVHGDYYNRSSNTYKSINLPQNTCIMLQKSLGRTEDADLFATLNSVSHQPHTVALKYCLKKHECKSPWVKTDYRLNGDDEECLGRYMIPSGKSYSIGHISHPVKGKIAIKPWIHAHRNLFRGLFVFRGSYHMRENSCYDTFSNIRMCGTDSFNYSRFTTSDSLLCHMIPPLYEMECQTNHVTDDELTMIVLNENTDQHMALQHTHFFTYTIPTQRHEGTYFVVVGQ